MLIYLYAINQHPREKNINGKLHSKSPLRGSDYISSIAMDVNENKKTTKKICSVVSSNITITLSIAWYKSKCHLISHHHLCIQEVNII